MVYLMEKIWRELERLIPTPKARQEAVVMRQASLNRLGQLRISWVT